MSSHHHHGGSHGNRHGSTHGEDTDPSRMWTKEFWDERYAGSEGIWSREPNPRLVERVADLAPGSALDVGSGEGTDAIWLAARGWTVTGVDLSQVALDRAATRADEAGAGERITWRQADLMDATTPVVEVGSVEEGAGGFDLVSAQFMHAPLELFDDLYRRLAAAVRPGGSLLVAGHHPADAETGVRTGGLSHLLFTAAQVTAVLDPGGWDLLVADALDRDWTDAEGTPVTVTDTVVHARRRS